MTRYPTYDRFTPVFHLGHVDRVYEASVSATPKKIQYEHEGISESQKIRFYDVMATPNNKTFKFAVPLLRGMSDSITRGDLISATKTKDNEKVYTSFRGDKMIDILEYLNGDKDE